jgi:hypothetical protein
MQRCATCYCRTALRDVRQCPARLSRLAARGSAPQRLQQLQAALYALSKPIASTSPGTTDECMADAERRKHRRSRQQLRHRTRARRRRHGRTDPRRAPAPIHHCLWRAGRRWRRPHQEMLRAPPRRCCQRWPPPPRRRCQRSPPRQRRGDAADRSSRCLVQAPSRGDGAYAPPPAAPPLPSQPPSPTAVAAAHAPYPPFPPRAPSCCTPRAPLAP